MSNKPQIPYSEFREFKDDYMRDFHHALTFGQAFCQKFGVNDPRISGAPSTTIARVRIDEAVEWVI